MDKVTQHPIGAANGGGTGTPPAVPLAEIVRFLDRYLDVKEVPDDSLNGLQVDGPDSVQRVAVAVDARESVIEAVAGWADLLIVHHGLFWGDLRPLTAHRFRRVKALIEGGMALYGVHLPLDSHPEAGNAAVLAGRIGVGALQPFGEYKGTLAGWRGTIGGGPRPLDDFRTRLAEVVERPVTTLPGGPELVASVAVVTGGGGDMVEEAAEAGVDVLVTGEARHHNVIDAAELGVTVLLGGHYATETFGVKRIAEILTDRFGVEGRFVDSPSGL